MGILKKLSIIQQELKAPKGQYNNYGGYKYRSCEDILEAVKPLLKKQGLALTIKDDLIAIDGRFYIKAIAQLFDETGKEIAFTTALAREEETKKGMDASQLTGSTSSYARKYALNGLFAIDDTKDADATNTHGKEEIKEQKKKKEKELSDIEEHIKNIKSCTNREELLKYWGSLDLWNRNNTEIMAVFKEMGKKFPNS